MAVPNEQYFDATQVGGKTTSETAAETAANALGAECWRDPQSSTSNSLTGRGANGDNAFVGTVTETVPEDFEPGPTVVKKLANAITDAAGSASPDVLNNKPGLDAESVKAFEKMFRNSGGNLSPEGMLSQMGLSGEELAKAFSRLTRNAKDVPSIGSGIIDAVKRELVITPLNDLLGKSHDGVITNDDKSKVLLLEDDFKKLGPRMDEFLRKEKFTSVTITPLEDGFGVALTRNDTAQFKGTKEVEGYELLKVGEKLSFDIAYEKSANGKPSGAIEIKNIKGLTEHIDIFLGKHKDENGEIVKHILPRDARVGELYFAPSADEFLSNVGAGKILGGLLFFF